MTSAAFGENLVVEPILRGFPRYINPIGGRSDRRIGIRWLPLFLCALWVQACGSGDGEKEKKVKVGLVADGTMLEDNTYNRLAYNGCMKAVTDFKLTFDYLECKGSTEFEPKLTEFGNAGYDHIISLAFVMGDATLSVAQQYPATNFAILDYQYLEYPTANLIGLAFREDQGGFLAGVLAGGVSTAKKVGCLGGMDIPAIRRFCNGFKMGVAHVCPSCETKIEYAGSFSNVEDGKTTAQKLIDAGVDVIFQAAGLTGSGGIAYAAAKGVYVIGVDQDEYKSTFLAGELPGADKILSSVIKRIDEAAYYTIEQTVKGTFQAGSVTFSLKNNAFEIAPFHDAAAAISQSVQDSLNAAMAALKDETLDTGVDPATGNLN